MDAYPTLGRLQILLQLPLEPFAYILHPALMALIFPAAVLSLFHLAVRSH